MQKDIKSLVPHASRLLQFENHPYSLKGFAPFGAAFKTPLPGKSIWKTGRQVGKSQNMAALGWLLAMLVPNITVMFALPFYKQARTLSYKRLKSIYDDSPQLHSGLLPRNHPKTQNTWERKSLLNGSDVNISYILTDVNRIRGETIDILFCDEFQEFNEDMLPIAESCMAASEYEVLIMTGTPLTTTNIEEEAWQNSSQGEWVVPCESCGKWNNPSARHHLLDMIGDDGPICAHCGKPVEPHHPRAHWEHAYPDRRATFEGHHVSHIILPLHYQKSNKWTSLLNKKRNWPKARFYNEVLGESQDTGRKRLSREDIQNACVLKYKKADDASKKRKRYDDVVLAADWGGKGFSETSRTAYAILGQEKRKRVYDLLHYKIFDITENAEVELTEMKEMYSKFKCDYFAFDAITDIGYVHMIKDYTHIPRKQWLPMIYTMHSSQKLMEFNHDPKKNKMDYYTLDKTRSLLITFEAIKRGFLRLPPYERFQKASDDLLAFEETSVTKDYQQIMRLRRESGTSDDLGDAINYGLSALLYTYGDFARMIGASDEEELSISLVAASTS